MDLSTGDRTSEYLKTKGMLRQKSRRNMNKFECFATTFVTFINIKIGELEIHNFNGLEMGLYA